ncbi:MAG: TRAP transporter small permease subunit [Gammaproteobacteria bacterium]|nr:TRAP transporter small permease subunit [Gammaproteobacteria bacterium]
MAPDSPIRHRLQALAHACDHLNERVGRAISWLTLVMVVTTFLIVVLRYLFDLGWIAMQESVTYMHALVFMLGAAYTLKHDGHVRVDIFYLKASPRRRALVDLLGSLLLLMPMMLYIFFISWDYVAVSWSLWEDSPETGGLPGVFLLKTAILALGVLMSLQGLAMAIHNGLFLAGIDTKPEQHSVEELK